MKVFWLNGLRLYSSTRIIVCAVSDTFRPSVCCLKTAYRPIWIANDLVLACEKFLEYTQTLFAACKAGTSLRRLRVEQQRTASFCESWSLQRSVISRDFAWFWLADDMGKHIRYSGVSFTNEKCGWRFSDCSESSMEDILDSLNDVIEEMLRNAKPRVCIFDF